MKCGKCDPDGYCACQDFFDGLRALGRGEYDHLLPPGGTRKGPTDMKYIDAIAAADMPYGTYVEVAQDGYARPDPTFECRGGVIYRPPGEANDCKAGDDLKVATDGPIMVLSTHGMNIPVVLEDGRVKGGPGVVPGLRWR